MRGIGHIQALLVAGAVGVSFVAWGCGNSKGTGAATDDTGAVVDEAGVSTTDDIANEDGGTTEEGVFISPGALTVAHEVGTTPCPTDVGSFTIDNVTNSAIKPTISIDPGVALKVDQTQPEIPAGGSVTIKVQFDCTTQDTFTAPVHVMVEGYEPQDISVTVNITKKSPT